MKMKISLCTVCMNRAEHIKKTLEKNIIDNLAYKQVEFVLLDYNSGDDLEHYVKTSLANYIASGNLVYFKTSTPEYFNRSHSRNLAFNLASGEVICNVDADNFTGKGFAKYINEVFSKKNDVFLSASGRFDIMGRIAVRREHFQKITGFDERMVYYGFEDIDFIQRLLMSGLKAHFIEDRSYLNVISHSNAERMSSEFVVNNFQRLFLNYISPALTELIFLFKNNVFYTGTMVNRLSRDSQKPNLKLTGYVYDYFITEGTWVKGEWMADKSTILLRTQRTDSHNELTPAVKENVYTLVRANQCSTFYEIADAGLQEEAVFFFSQITNRFILEQNLEKKRISVNTNGYGKDNVYKNFDFKNLIKI